MSGAGLSAFASLLLPAEGGALITADAEWAPPVELPPDVDVVVWGNVAGQVGDAWVSTGARAVRREMAVTRLRARPPAGWRVERVHRPTPAATRRDRFGRTLRSVLVGGVLVELRRGTGPARQGRIDEVLRAAGVSGPIGRKGWHLGPGGSLLGFVQLRDSPGGARAVLRAATGESPGIARGIAALRTVTDLAVAPKAIEDGRTAGVTWSIEEAMLGSPPIDVSPALVAEVAARWRVLPSSGGPPTATADDLAQVAASFPNRSDELFELANRVAEAGMPATLRHGDLWAGNLLVGSGGRFTSAIDWDHWHPAAVPGTDLLQLIATQQRHAARADLGTAFLGRPWRQPEVSRHLPTDVDLDLVGLAWWATEVAGTLQRDPAKAGDVRWVKQNVDAVVDSFTA